MKRRRFLSISAAFCVAGRAMADTHAQTDVRWQGRALGAEASITLRGSPDVAEAALRAAQAELEKVEGLFSLYRDRSWITRLNAEGASAPAGQARGLLDLCDHMHKATGGLFDPTVQVLWDAAAQGHAPDTVRHLVGWEHVALGTEIRLAPDQRITLNGIAQGWATDRVTEVLSTHGFTDALVNIGEFRAEAGDWRIGIADPFEGIVRTARLSGGAVATSSPAGDRIGTQSHIFGPHGETAQWSTVSVEARTAALADAMSTALCLAPRKLAEEMLLQPDITAITLVAPNGDMAVLR